MKNWAVIALCFFSSLANATDVEEIVVTARQVKIVLAKLSESHVQDPKTGEWHYVEKKEEQNKA